MYTAILGYAIADAKSFPCANQSKLSVVLMKSPVYLINRQTKTNDRDS